uniref:LON peptidase N-terminal domain and ring finger 1 n=1 Tax=Oryzias sinensis TaxID=183150 RepID=A0A8C7XA52_9TELE
MSLQPQVAEAPEERLSFFIGADPVSGGEEEDHSHHCELILEKGNALASKDCLKEAIDWFSAAVRYGPVRPEQLSTFVDCILRNFKTKTAGREGPTGLGEEEGEDSVLLECPNCRGFLGEPVTVACGHSYCRRCLHRRLLSKCKLCCEPVSGEEKLNVTLCGLVEKCFPEELKKLKTLSEVDAMCKRKRYREAVSHATAVLRSDPHMMAARLSRAEAYMALKQYRLALEDAEFCSRSTCSAEALFRKAMVLHEMGQVDKSLQVFLHCLSVNEDFPGAKRQVEKILCDLLSPADENIKVGLKETTQNTLPHLRSKALMAEAQPQCPVQRAHQQQNRAVSAHQVNSQEKRWESLERPGLSRTQSLRTHGCNSGDEGLKRVSSAPQLGDQDKGSLLKRKLSVSDLESCFVDSGSSKYKKQGVTKGTKQHISKAKTCKSVPEGMLDSSDLECSLCMRLFYEPVTTPCGHTFCKNCLERCLDHTPHCPLCKESLKEYLACRKYMVTTVLEVLIKQHLSHDYAERTKTHLEETREHSDLTKNVPIFVCTMAYPTVPCPLHVFEPRYRLMIRRCMDTGTRQFGMCISDSQKGFADHGCMLIIRSVHFLPDGRSVVDTIGGKRFQVLSRGMKDGYSTADIEYLQDSRVEDTDELEKLQELHDAVYEQAQVWFQNLKIRFHNQILQHFGPMPEREADIQATPNGPACCWWLLAVLPIDPRYQLSVLSMTSLKDRLVKIQHILTYLQSIPNN